MQPRRSSLPFTFQLDVELDVAPVFFLGDMRNLDSHLSPELLLPFLIRRRAGSDLDGASDGAEADVAPYDLPVFWSMHSFRLFGRGMGDTYELACFDSTSDGTPESCGQSPRSPPGVPAFSGG